MNLEMHSRWVGNVLVMQCVGRLVAGEEVQAFHREVTKALTEMPVAVINLNGVQFLDSSGIGTLVRLAGHARTAGGDVKLCCVPEIIHKTLKLTKVDRVLEVHASEADALEASYRGPAMSPTRGASRRLLLVHPSQDCLAFAAQVLRGAGYEVLTAGNVPDARVLLKASKPDLVIAGEELPEAASDMLREMAGRISIITLEAGFGALDPTYAAERLIGRVKAAVPA